MAAAAGARAAVDADVAGGQRHRDGCTGWSDEDPHFGASSTELKRKGDEGGTERVRERKGWRVQVGYIRVCVCVCVCVCARVQQSGGRARDERGRRTTLTIARERMQHETVHGPRDALSARAHVRKGQTHARMHARTVQRCIDATA